MLGKILNISPQAQCETTRIEYGCLSYLSVCKNIEWAARDGVRYHYDTMTGSLCRADNNHCCAF